MYIYVYTYRYASIYGSSAITVRLLLSHRTPIGYVVGTSHVVQRLGRDGTMDRIGSRSAGCARTLEVEGSMCTNARRRLSIKDKPSTPATRSRGDGQSQ